MTKICFARSPTPYVNTELTRHAINFTKIYCLDVIVRYYPIYHQLQNIHVIVFWSLYDHKYQFMQII